MTKREFIFSNGEKVREKVTGFTGTITGTAFYLTGCNQYLVVPKVKDEHTAAEGQWYDEGRLELVEDEKPLFAEDVKSKENGCDMVAPGGKRGA